MVLQQPINAFALGNGQRSSGEQSNDLLSLDAIYESRSDSPSCQPGQRHCRPSVFITEQPARKARNFRYKSEGRAPGLIPGVHSTTDQKTYPAIKIVGYSGPVTIVVSCVTKDLPYRPHPHNVVIGHEKRKAGACILETQVSAESNEIQFKNLGILCATKDHRVEELMKRQKNKIDPFRTGFAHIDDGSKICLNAVRLCFQVFIPDDQEGGKGEERPKCRRPLKPVVSEPVFDKKVKSDLIILDCSECSGPPKGGTKVILVCEKVTKDDKVLFCWEGNSEFPYSEVPVTQPMVYKNMAVAFLTPPFKMTKITEPVIVQIVLESATDSSRSNPIEFKYVPDYIDLRYKTKEVSTLLQLYDNTNVPQPGPSHATENQMKPQEKPQSYMLLDEEQWPDSNQAVASEPNDSQNPFEWNLPWPHHANTNPFLQTFTRQDILSPDFNMSRDLTLSPETQLLTDFDSMQGMSPERICQPSQNEDDSQMDVESDSLTSILITCINENDMPDSGEMRNTLSVSESLRAAEQTPVL
ncbi:embryonic polarity protein dorsal-like isoform X2 [Anticarsia gemmatalis]|uniref:embryonic polarity protein dorsal-like isoform X2 n=1 Tax=Anticarsia gemmatalis TaxID=129554 RepID=UPI003F76DD64